MMQWTVTTLSQVKVTLSLETDNQNQSAAIAYQYANTADAIEAVAELKELLLDSYGAYGHLMDAERTTAADLDSALKSLYRDNAIFDLEGNLAAYDPALPEGALS